MLRSQSVVSASCLWFQRPLLIQRSRDSPMNPDLTSLALSHGMERGSSVVDEGTVVRRGGFRVIRRVPCRLNWVNDVWL